MNSKIAEVLDNVHSSAVLLLDNIHFYSNLISAFDIIYKEHVNWYDLNTVNSNSRQ